VLVRKATQLATEQLEQLLGGAKAHGLSRGEALAIVDRTIEELRERDESDQVFQRLCEALEAEVERRSDV
jgi:uncharacterized protein YoaH (UPF0181 family)